MELNDNLHLDIITLLNTGKELAIRERYEESISLYSKALELIPEPQIDYDINTWLHIEIGDSYYKLKDYENALIHYKNAYNSVEGVNDAYLWFCLGRLYYYLENMEDSKRCLIQSFTLEGDEYFVNQDDKFLDLIKQDVIIADDEEPTTDLKKSDIDDHKEKQKKVFKNIFSQTKLPGTSWSLLDDKN